MKPLLVFDMDGVLVEVRESYREAIIQTVAQFGGPRLTQRDIQVHKSRGGFNNDWVLSWTLLKENGIELSYQTVVEAFQLIYRGANEDGLLLRERWFPREGLLERLVTRYQFALFTGRLREEAKWALRHFACPHPFDPFIGMDDVTMEKPSPEGLLKIAALTGQRDFTYVGDTADDLRAANGAGVRFIGIAAPDLPEREVLLKQFQDMGAAAIIPDINSLEEVL
jgi:HAD superfamily hydrolase (TIGR01548 family)